MVYIVVDTQVVLSGLLSKDIKAKTLFTKNKLKDIQEMNN